ncbi:hypothetical protein LTR37_006651 [Vermiconidia calcicola]|uniref:Uncharacterized protein n=1 Tax=Vermiconidia calcicola TaxID=1690605 RepID=A0ACC3NHJ3_9PEZI|nr:hypothetical protein LTR37_006651 [Vermiconidia calcicola]
MSMCAPNLVRSQPHRKDSWGDASCDPLSTLLPGALWDYMPPPNAAAAAYATPTSRSDYSAGSHLSAWSSPCTRSEVCSQPPTLPRVKIESQQEMLVPSRASVPEASPRHPLDNSRLRTTQHPDSKPVEERIKAYLAPSSTSDPDESKPRIGREDRRRACSSEDLRVGHSEDRQKRCYTKPEDASCFCEKCGKLFQRTYNLKAHMETHDPQRSAPHACEYTGCDKKFVRRTDLLRHEQSATRNEEADDERTQGDE